MAATAVRVRFAPSPTGFLHLGGLRTALFNYLFAKRHGGKFLLRIEDTDQKRTVPGAAASLERVLAWAGLTVDESPSNPSGNCGPYVQSQRLPLYQHHIKQLLDKGVAYRCFCSPDRLANLRATASTAGLSKVYDGACRSLSDKQIEEGLHNNTPHTVRLRVPRGGATTFHDAVYGTITVQHQEIDDQVLIKSDGFPTYHFANTVDDHLMKITHVMRGEEWLSSTAKHVLLYQGFGWQPPVFVHLPLLFNKDHSKVSKRQGDLFVESLAEQGFLPMAVVNFVAYLGWSPPAGDNSHVFVSLDAMASAFDLKGLRRAGAVVDMPRLQWMHEQHFRALTPQSDAMRYSIKFVSKLLAAKQMTANTSQPVDNTSQQQGQQHHQHQQQQLIRTDGRRSSGWTDEYIEKVLVACRKQAPLLTQLVNNAEFAYFWRDPENPDTSTITKDVKDVIVGLASEWSTQPDASFTQSYLKASIASAAKASGIAESKILKPLRLVITGAQTGSPLVEILAALGRTVCARRLARLQ